MKFRESTEKLISSLSNQNDENIIYVGESFLMVLNESPSNIYNIAVGETPEAARLMQTKQCPHTTPVWQSE